MIRDGSLVIVLAEREEQAVAAAERLAGSARWEPVAIDDAGDPDRWLRSRPAEPYVAAEPTAGVETADGGRRLSATYTRPYHSHGPMAPSCAVARFADGRL
ncbi:MAG: xanthine dehydrogenase family protein molybdopterin-binding subunit, partial [Gemmatimonadetes bacterium]|nr:xanthine dehydrogenase family protein molybdopterin-binding subunit [Gemmatimonadota bacterium]NIR37942.1 xanthine dehydrogenase family protein molybdopterin-binding subunit [Actinomycetota bacterium]NIS32494.1 xanthine dehydrogenase family protein molybdopterin-binding subunit [Actinomycetota bacterium]NIU67512.1 xanthine dehydrogenase family protein molybdopterin-binding subunit [Actinomycetota bacterium]NIX21787.1 xanthine dehydrogenase family protein molybdopterin-binding subunit [Actino